MDHIPNYRDLNPDQKKVIQNEVISTAVGNIQMVTPVRKEWMEGAINGMKVPIDRFMTYLKGHHKQQVEQFVISNNLLMYYNNTRELISCKLELYSSNTKYFKCTYTKPKSKISVEDSQVRVRPKEAPKPVEVVEYYDYVKISLYDGITLNSKNYKQITSNYGCDDERLF